jgi:hypothetical protein
MREERQERRRDRRHAAPRDESGFAPFERRELLVEHDMVGGVVEADVADVVVAGRAAGLVGRRLEDGEGDGAGDARADFASVNERGFEAHGVSWSSLRGAAEPTMGATTTRERTPRRPLRLLESSNRR